MSKLQSKMIRNEKKKGTKIVKFPCRNLCENCHTEIEGEHMLCPYCFEWLI